MEYFFPFYLVPIIMIYNHILHNAFFLRYFWQRNDFLWGQMPCAHIKRLTPKNPPSSCVFLRAMRQGMGDKWYIRLLTTCFYNQRWDACYSHYIHNRHSRWSAFHSWWIIRDWSKMMLYSVVCFPSSSLPRIKENLVLLWFKIIHGKLFSFLLSQCTKNTDYEYILLFKCSSLTRVWIDALVT